MLKPTCRLCFLFLHMMRFFWVLLLEEILFQQKKKLLLEEIDFRNYFLIIRLETIR